MCLHGPHSHFVRILCCAIYRDDENEQWIRKWNLAYTFKWRHNVFSFIFLLCACQYRRYASQAECGRKFLTDNWICEWILVTWVQVHMIFIWSDSNLPIGRIAFCARSWTCCTHNDCENETIAVRYNVSFCFQSWSKCNRENRFICIARHRAVEVRVSRSTKQIRHD